MKISHFPSTTNHTVTKEEEIEWGDLVQWIRTPRPNTIPKDELPLWSPATYREGWVKGANVIAVYAVGFDVDTEAVSAATLAGLPWRGVAHTTSSSRADALRWRLLLALSRAVTAAEYRHIWLLIAACLPFGVGQQAKNADRGWFVPRVGADGSYEVVTSEGEPLDVDDLLTVPVPAAAAAPAVSDGTPAFVKPSELPAALTQHAKRIGGALGAACPVKGHRHEAALALAGALTSGRLPFHIEDTQIPAFVAVACETAGFNALATKVQGARDTVHKAQAGTNVVGFGALVSQFPAVAAAVDPVRAVMLSADAEIKPEKSEKSEIISKKISAADRARRIGGYEVTRLPTGFYTVDLATRGGIMMRKLVVIGGAPGAGKTALLVKWGFEWLTRGYPVGMLATDEDADAILIRFGQLAGLDREALEAGDLDAREKLAAWCESVPLLLCDGDEDETTIEQMSRALRKLANGRPSALLVDSMQTARCEEEVPKAGDLRLRVNATMRSLKKAAKVDGHVVAASSELSKGAYRNKAQADNINALSAFKESGDIEYGVSMALVLTSCAGSSDLVEAQIVKNRLGRGKPEFLLKLDHDRADVRETRIDIEREADPDYDKKKTVREELEKHPGGVSRTALYDKIGGRVSEAKRVVDAMLDSHFLHEDSVTKTLRRPLPGEPGFGD